MATTEVPLPDDLLEALDRMAEDQGVDRSTILRKALERGLEDLLLDEAVDRYQQEEISAWKAARSSGVTLTRFLEELEARGLGLATDDALLAEQIEGLSRAMSGIQDVPIGELREQADEAARDDALR